MFAERRREAFDYQFSLWGGDGDYRWDDAQQTYVFVNDEEEEDPDDMADAS